MADLREPVRVGRGRTRHRGQTRLPRRLASLSRARIARRAAAVEPPASRHLVPDDPKDSPILKAALAAGVDYLVTNDHHLLSLDPYEALRIVSLADYEKLLVDAGLLRRR